MQGSKMGGSGGCPHTPSGASGFEGHGRRLGEAEGEFLAKGNGPGPVSGSAHGPAAQVGWGLVVADGEGEGFGRQPKGFGSVFVRRAKRGVRWVFCGQAELVPET